MDRGVVLGAGPLGTSVARQLEARGATVLLASVLGDGAYDMPGTRPPRLDGRDAAQIAELCREAGALYLCLNARYVDWYGSFPGAVETAIEAAARANTRLVYADDVSLYGPADGPLTEDLPALATTRKGGLRARLARDVLTAHAEGRTWTAIGRTADMYGPGALNSSLGSTFGERQFYPALAGKPMRILGDVDAPHTYVFVDDFAVGLITLGDNEEAGGQAWHVPAAPTLSHRELATIVYEEAGHEPRIRSSSLATAATRVTGRFRANVGEVSELLYQFERPHVVDHGKFERSFGAGVTPHREAVRDTLVWYRDNPIDSLRLAR